MNQFWLRCLPRSRAFWAVALLSCFLLVAPDFFGAPCPQTRLQQQGWVAARVDSLVRAAYAAYQIDKGKKAYERVLDGVTRDLRQCQLERDKEFVTRYRELVDYLKVVSLTRSPDHELGFSVPDKQYFAETRQYVEIPDFLLTPNFLRAVSRFATLNEAKFLLRELNTARTPDAQLIFFSYKSRHLGTPDNDNSFWRLLIVVPGNAAQHVPEKWVQFGVPDPRALAPVRNVSVVSAMPGPDGTTNVYFKDNFRTYRRDGSITINGRWELGYGDDNCAQCHKSGILPIFPVAGSVSRNEQQAVQAVNERFLSYTRPRFDKYLDATKLGPGLGSTSSEVLHKRFGSGFDSSVVAKSMVCASCHQPNGLGSLSWPMDRVVISSYVNGGKMPLGYDLPKTERPELYRKLIQDYFAIDEANPGILKAWLLGRLR